MLACLPCSLQEVLLLLKPLPCAHCALSAPFPLEATGSRAALVPLAKQVHLAPLVKLLALTAPQLVLQARLHRQPPLQAVNAAVWQVLDGPVVRQQAAARSALSARLALEWVGSPARPVALVPPHLKAQMTLEIAIPLTNARLACGSIPLAPVIHLPLLQNVSASLAMEVGV
jgi:hypothetical protein